MNELTRESEWKQPMNMAGSIVAVLLLVLLAFALYALVKFDVKPDNHDILLVVITFLTTKVSTIVDFFFGGSSTNRKKDDTINALASNAPPASGSQADVTATANN